MYIYIVCVGKKAFACRSFHNMSILKRQSLQAVHNKTLSTSAYFQE